MVSSTRNKKPSARINSRLASPALTTSPPLSPADLRALKRLDERILWLASYMIHHANHLRPSRDGIKVGGHQASCASLTTMMAALFFHFLRPEDRIAVKPHAGPVLHAIEYLFGRQSAEQLQKFRGFGGAQSYPSRTKDQIGVDFSTGSVGLGVAITVFSSLLQDFWLERGKIAAENAGRFIALLGDAELDEGNIYEALIEGYKHDVRNLWWIVDYNRQSLDAVTTERMWDRFDDMFETVGWRVETLRFGAAQQAAFAEPGGAALRDFILSCPNDLYAALSFEGGAAWRTELAGNFGENIAAQKWLATQTDDDLAFLMTQLGGHCLETILAAFARSAQTDQPTLFIAYTIKGYRLPFQGHKDNHSGLMTPGQLESLRTKLGISDADPWDALSGLAPDERANIDAVLRQCPWAAAADRNFRPAPIDVPPLSAFEITENTGQSTQTAFGKILNELGKSDSDFAARLVTTSPDVTVSTNLGGFVGRRGLFARQAKPDLFRQRKIASPQNWARGPMGQHIELGIAENNLFLNLAALGLSGAHFGENLFPIGTLYDPFIARGLDALNYALYQDARCILVATPSGLTLGPEGGAHQSISTPLIGISQPGLLYYEPAFADELSQILHHACEQLHEAHGCSIYLRLSTRALTRPDRARETPGTDWRRGAIEGAYWRRAPKTECGLVLAYVGAVAPEAEQALDLLLEDYPDMGFLAITSPDRLYRDWQLACQRRARSGQGDFALSPDPLSLIERLFQPLSRDAGIITLMDGAPASLSWLGGVHGHRVHSLGVTKFGQTGDLPDLYAHYGLDADAVLDAAAQLWMRSAHSPH